MPRSTNISSAIFVAVAAFVLLSCETHSDEFEIAGSSDDIVVLADGATIAAPAGTRARALADWIGAGASGERFALGDGIGRASWREGGCQYVLVSVGAGLLKKKTVSANK